MSENTPPARRQPLIGRSAELDRLLRLLGTARTEGQLAVLQGPAGIGKTRLAEELLAVAHEQGCRTALGRCWPDGEAPPFWPWRAALQELGGAAGLLDETPGEAPLGRFPRFLAVLEHLRSLGSPVTVVLDDVHLADPASLLLARFLAHERRLPLFLLLTRRDDAKSHDRETLDLLSSVTRDAVALRLSGLSAKEVGTYLASHGASAPDAALVQVVAAVTQGNPLHLRSVTLQSEGPGGMLGGLAQAIDGVFGRLSEADRVLVACAAVLAPEVSVHEVSAMSEVAPPAVAESFARAARVGLMAETPTGRFAFVHDVVRRAATAALSVAERLDAHARAAALPAGHDPERMARRAHHALAAATRSREDADAAVGVARDAARALREVDGFESAATLLGRAADVHAAASLDRPLAPVAVERAECVLACGRLAEARPLFRQAARLAELEDDPVALAGAALGLGGVWVGEHRLAEEAERVRALQRRALERLPEAERVLRTRLSVRLAIEGMYRGGSVEAALAAVDEARRSGDRRALAEALSLCHHALLIPDASWWRRLDLANELIGTAAAAGDGLLSLVGLCWRTADLWLLGDSGAAAALEELRQRADALGCKSILFIVRAMEVMLAIRSGQFAAAETGAAACFALGEEVGDADALAYHGAHLCAIRYYQGREAELAGLASSLAASPTLIEERERAFSSAAALFALRAGRPEPARALLDHLGREGLASLPPSSSWLLALSAVAEMAYLLGDAAVARAAQDALRPYADLPVMGSLGVVCFGSVRRALGLAALATDDVDDAVEQLAAAVSANERLGHRPAAVQARAELGLAYLRRSGAAERTRGRALIEEAAAGAEALGMSGLPPRWREAAARVQAAPTPAAPASPGATMSLVQAGRWRVVHEGEIATVPDRVGMHYLARLLSAPDQGVPALALVADDAANALSGRADAVMDRPAVAALRARIVHLREQDALSPLEQDELATLTRELARATGLQGRIRSFTDMPERARTAVTKAIKRAIDEIAAANPVVGRHLADRIETGSVCRYRSS